MGIIIGKLCHISYNSNIDFTGGSYLRPQPKKHITDYIDILEKRNSDTDSLRVLSKDSNHQ
jgi:hypothetical protein